MTITGIIKRVEPTKEIGAENFKVREIHITTDEQYSQTLNIQFVQDKCAQLDNFATGEKVKIDINLKGRETTKDGKTTVFNTLAGWKIEKIS